MIGKVEPLKQELKKLQDQDTTQMPDNNQLLQGGEEPEVDVLESETDFHQVGEMNAVSVIDHELQFLSQQVKDTLIEAKIDQLNFNKEQIEDQIGGGLLSPETYLQQIREYRQTLDPLLSQAKGYDLERIKKRVMVLE